MSRLTTALVASSRREILLAGILAFSLFLVGTARIPILGLDEGRFSQASREMIHRGDPVVPTFVGEGRYHKPILIYWLTMASYTGFGVTERAARIPANVAGALSVMLLAWSARRRFGAGAGLLAGMLLATSLTFHVQAKACTADMVLFLPTLVVMLAFERIVAGATDWRIPLALWIGMGLAILAKGPIAPLWVLATAIALWAFGRRWKPWEITGMAALLLAGAWSLGPPVLLVPAAVAGYHLVRSSEARDALRRLRLGWGLPLVVVIVAPWIVAVEAATGGAFLREAIGTHVVSRSVSAFESHGFFPGFYLVTAPLVAFPWFGFLVGVVWSRLADAANGWVRNPTFRFMAAWLVGPWLVLELVQTKLVHYWMPSYPAGILLVVGWVVAVRGTGVGFGLPTRLLVLATGVVVALVPTAITLYLGVARLWPSAAAATLVLAGSTIAAVVLAGRTPLRAISTLAVGTAVFLAVLFGNLLPDLATDSIPPLAGRRASELVGPNERVVVFKPRDDDLFFYLPVGSGACKNAGCLDGLWRDGAPFLAVTRIHDFEVLKGEWPGVDLVEIDRVAGIDLNRAERAEVVIFRVRDLP